MKKITNKFRPRECLYKLGNKVYLSQPNKTKIKYYVEQDGVYTAILKRDFNVLVIIALFCIIASIYFKLTNNFIYINIKCPTTMHLADNVLSLDLQNNSDYNINYKVLYNSDVISNGMVKANESYSNVDCEYSISSGNYSGKLIVEYAGYVKESNILIVVN